MRVYTRTIFIVSFLALLAPPLVSAQASQSTGTPADVSFTMRFKSGKTSFYQGELITIEMLFSSTTPDTYCLTPNGRAEVQSARKALDDRIIHIDLSSSDDFPINITLGNSHPQSIDQLKTKLSTMPKDSHFVWQCFSQDAEAETRLFQELKTFLAERGMTLEQSEKQN
jgi:hypothetical protein